MNITKGHRRHGAWAPGGDIHPRCRFVAADLLNDTAICAGLAHVYTDRVVSDVFHDGIDMDL